MKRTLALLLITLLVIALPALALADTGGTTEQVLVNTLIESAVEIVGAFFIALIGAFGAWLTLQIGKNTKLSSINKAQAEIISLAQQTVGELQQTTVEGLKAAHKDGKLSETEIKELGTLLLDKVTAKMSVSAAQLLTAAKVDVAALIAGAAENWIGTLKQEDAA